MEKQTDDLEKAMKRLAEQHREKVALCERQFIQQKHQIKRGDGLLGCSPAAVVMQIN